MFKPHKLSQIFSGKNTHKIHQPQAECHKDGNKSKPLNSLIIKSPENPVNLSYTQIHFKVKKCLVYF